MIWKIYTFACTIVTWFSFNLLSICSCFIYIFHFYQYVQRYNVPILLLSYFYKLKKYTRQLYLFCIPQKCLSLDLCAMFLFLIYFHSYMFIKKYFMTLNTHIDLKISFHTSITLQP